MPNRKAKYSDYNTVNHLGVTHYIKEYLFEINQIAKNNCNFESYSLDRLKRIAVNLENALVDIRKD